MPDSPTHDSVEALRADFRARVGSARTDADLKTLHDEFLSRKSGSVTGLLKQLGSLVPDLRREIGALVNELKTDIESALDERRAALSASRPPAGAVDVTLPGRELPLGRIHPLMRVRQEVEDIFTRMGYEILEGPEVEDDFHNFEALNMSPDHPARDTQDTLYLEAPIIGGTWGAHRASTIAQPALNGVEGRRAALGGQPPESQARAATLLRTHTSAKIGRAHV